MKVNIVCPDMPKDTILYRLADTLAQITGWNLTNYPRPNHDLNYNIVYIDYAQRFTDWKSTPWAAYFSHYETGTPYKEYWWKIANDGMKIKTVTAKQYGEMLSGKVIKITPPIEPVYTPIDRKKNKRPLFGFSGFVDRSGRKGEKLAARLANDLEQADFIASGHGWPVNTVLNKLEDLPKFYNSLDVYICTSLIEGIPMPPLEALACGVPVVIPEGVGLLDELPANRGIYRYTKGDYQSLLEAATNALRDNDTQDRQELSNIVAHMTPKQFADDHRRGFEKALASEAKRPAKYESDRHGQRGVYYVAFGDPARECANSEALSIVTLICLDACLLQAA